MVVGWRKWCHISLVMVAFLLFTGCASEPSTTITIVVRRLPDSDIVDMTKGELPPLADAVVAVRELGLEKVTDANGQVMFVLPLGRTPGYARDEAVYTFDVWVPTPPFHTVVRRRITPDEPRFEIHYNPKRNVTIQ